MVVILEVTRALAAPFELHAMLEAVATAARRVLQAERVSVWLHDPLRQDLYVEVATDRSPMRVPIGQGLVDSCARDRVLINVSDCYADLRFNVAIDRQLGLRTRRSLTVPLVDHLIELVGVLQLLNREQGVFAAAGEDFALAMAAQCAVALSRVRMTKALIAAELVEQEVELARVVQRAPCPRPCRWWRATTCKGPSRRLRVPAATPRIWPWLSRVC